MIRLYILGMVLWAIGWQLAGFVSQASAGESARDVLSRYVRAAINDNWDDAESCWLPSAVEASEKLGIEFEGVTLKIACETSLYKMLDSLRSGVATYWIGQEQRRTFGKEVEVGVKLGSIKVVESYFLIKAESGWNIVPELAARTLDWDVRESKYLSVRHADDPRVNSVILSYADAFVDSAATMLGLDPSLMGVLEREKIDYYLLSEKALKKEFGKWVAGVMLQSTHSVVSSHIPHTHEIAHVLIEFATQRLPRLTPTFLREGSAVAVGGRRYLSPNMSMQVGHSTIGDDLRQFESMLPPEEDADVWAKYGSFLLGYQTGAVLSDCLIRTLGPAQFVDLYRRLSAVNPESPTLSKQSVLDTLRQILGVPYERFIEKCQRDSERYSYTGVRAIEAPPDTEPAANGETRDFSVLLWESDTTLFFEVVADGRRPAGALLFRCEGGDSLATAKSTLFQRHFPSRDFKGECLGLAFSSVGVVLLDFRLDRIEAMYVAYPRSGVPPVWDSTSNSIRFSVERALMPGDVAQTISMLRRN